MLRADMSLVANSRPIACYWPWSISCWWSAVACGWDFLKLQFHTMRIFIWTEVWSNICCMNASCMCVRISQVTISNHKNFLLYWTSQSVWSIYPTWIALEDWEPLTFRNKFSFCIHVQREFPEIIVRNSRYNVHDDDAEAFESLAVSFGRTLQWEILTLQQRN